MIVSLEDQSAAVTAKQGDSLNLHKLVEAVEDSELGVKDIKIVIKGRIIEQDGRLAITEDIKGTLFLIAEGLKADEAMMGKELKLVGKIHAIKMKRTPPHLVVESFELIGN
ncbi:MAG: hypothetical protein ACE5IC_03355 [Candidatus Brocadiales bacterium]